MSDEEQQIKQNTLAEASAIYDKNVQFAYLLAELRIMNHRLERLNECRDRKLAQCPLLNSAELEVLRQCRRTIWDGYVASKAARSSLVDKGLVVRYKSWQVITKEGMAVLDTLGEMRDERWGTNTGTHQHQQPM